ncbi:glycosyltransferase [Candidatus Bathyarchaeota archaeon]|nr:glycosyltransferase [Candidatus Bathyarchaeota archaeon]
MRTDDEPRISIIVPTLNEETHIGLLLNSLKYQSPVSFETLIVDGGSKDKTPEIAHQHNAKVVILPEHGEFVSRNVGAKMSKGHYLLFTCADIIFPKDIFQKIIDKFEKNPELVALSGPGYPFDAPLLGKVEYAIYNLLRYLVANLPKPFKRFSTSTNFLVVRKGHFGRTGGFIVDDINADGLMGKELLDIGDVAFYLDTYIYSSARRMKNMGFIDFNRHYLYAIENFFFFASNKGVIKAWKLRATRKHRKMREV